jgi:hypothetical protein
MLIPIVSGLLSGVEKLSNNKQNQELALPALDLIDLVLKMISQYKNSFANNLQQSVCEFN